MDRRLVSYSLSKNKLEFLLLLGPFMATCCHRRGQVLVRQQTEQPLVKIYEVQL